MKYRYFMINQIFNYDIYYIDFFVTIGNYINPEITTGYMEYASNYKAMFEKLMEEFTGVSVRVAPGGQMYEIDKYDLYFIKANDIIGSSSWTNGADGIVWTISLNNKLKSIPVKNWDEIINFIKDNI